MVHNEQAGIVEGHFETTMGQRRGRDPAGWRMMIMAEFDDN